MHKCLICNYKKFNQVLNLKKQPLANSLRFNKKKKQKKYPLNLIQCKNCSTVQLNYIVNPKQLFENYVWTTNSSKAINNYAKFFFNKFNKVLKKKSKVLEVASNDGTFLRYFKQKKHFIIGVDPAKNIAKIANKNRIKTLPKFFNFKTSNSIKKKYKKFDFIFARNVIPHVKEINSIIKGIYNLLEDTGTCAVEFHYAGKIIDELHYDSIYHEHLHYFTIKTISKLFAKFKLYPYNVFKSPISGGSLVIYFSKTIKKKTNFLEKLIKIENQKKYNSFKTWNNFGIKSYSHKKKLFKILKSYKNKDYQIIGYGASARSSTVINYTGLNEKIINYIIDNNPLKMNKYSPGTGIKIQKFSQNLISNRKLCLVIFAWNFKDEIIRSLKKSKVKTKLLIPFPNKITVHEI